MAQMWHVIALWHCRGFAVRGHHISKDFWIPTEGEMLSCIRETTNRFDPFAVAVKKDGVIVGHVSRTIAAICSLFL